MALELKRVYRFADFTLDAAERSLKRGAEEVHLQPKTFETLLYLVERRGRLVKKEELLSALWADVFVTENALARCVKEVREALGDDARNSRFIRTVPRVGYRFIAEVEHISSPAEENEEFEEEITAVRVVVTEETQDGEAAALPPKRQLAGLLPGGVGARLWRFLALALLIAASGFGVYFLWPKQTPRVRSIAVLPFKPLVDGSRDELMELGMADTLITRLSKVKQIIVRPTSDVRRFTALDQDPVEAGRQLNVDSALDGSIQRLQDRVRVTVRLISVRDRATIWADQFDAKATDIFAIQDSISERVATKLVGQLTGEERKQLTRHHTDSAEAYEHYLKGRFYFHQRREDAGWKAVMHFRQAIDADPNYALAYAGLADVYAQASSKFYPPGEAMPLARTLAMKASELDDSLAECHLSVAKVKWWGDWDWAGAESAFRRAIDLNPNDTHVHREFARFLAQQGRFDEALAEITRAQQIEPVSPENQLSLGWVLYYAGRYDKAIAAYRQGLSLSQNFAALHRYLALALAQKREFEEATSAMARALELENDYAFISDLAYVHSLAGNRVEAIKRLEEVKQLSTHRYVSPYGIAKIYAGLGQKEDAVAWLERAYEDRSDHLLQLRVDPAFGGLRSDPRLADLLLRLGHGR